MLFYLPAAVCASLDPALLPVGMVAVRAADLQSLPGERGAVPAGAAVAPGTVVTFCQPVVTVPAVARGGLVLADGWLPELVRLGELERPVACQNSGRAPDLGFYPWRSCLFASSTCS